MNLLLLAVLLVFIIMHIINKVSIAAFILYTEDIGKPMSDKAMNIYTKQAVKKMFRIKDQSVD